MVREIYAAWLVGIVILSGCVGQAPPKQIQEGVQPGQGIDFQQIDFLFTEVSLYDSNWGRLEADPKILANSTGLTEGFLNVFTEHGWAVQNMPLFAGEKQGPLSAYFNLGLTVPSQDVTALKAYITYTPEPLSEPQKGSFFEFPVGAEIWNAEGVGGLTTSIGRAPPFSPVP